MKELLYGKTRTYLVHDILLVDTDLAGTLPGFFRKLKETGVSSTQLRYLLITHYHPDHMGIAMELMTYGISLVIFDVQLPYIHFSDGIYQKEKRCGYQPIDESKSIILRCDESRSFLASVGIAGEVIPTPGHSEDSVSLILDDGSAMVGDLPPYSVLDTIDDDTVMHSYRALLSHGAKRFHYGHMVSETVDEQQEIQQ